MKRQRETLTIDGSQLTLYECLSCSVRVFAGIDAQRRIVQRAGDAPPSKENL